MEAKGHSAEGTHGRRAGKDVPLSREEVLVQQKLHRASNSRSCVCVWDRGIQRLEFPSACFRSLRKLRVIRNNELEVVSPRIGSYSQLESLNLSSNPRLSSVPTSVGSLTSLRFLCLKACDIAMLPASLTGLGALEHLDCSVNRISALPADMYRLRRLHTLNVSQNLLKQIMDDHSLSLMTALIFVDFSYCRLISVSGSLFNLPRLRRVRLEGNRGLQELPSSVSSFWKKTSTHRKLHHLWNGTAIKRLPCLKTVYDTDVFIMDHMNDVEMPPSLAHMRFSRLCMKSCTVLELSSCRFPSTVVSANMLSAGLTDVACLEPLLSSSVVLSSLHLDFNSLPCVPDFFASFTALTTLCISTNPSLSSFSARAAAGLCSLELLEVNNCALVDMGPICAIRSLHALSLRDNAIEVVPNAVSQLTNLTAFDVSNNNIWYFDEGLAALGHLVRLSLTNNPATEDLLGDPSGELRHEIGPTLADAFSRKVGRKTKRAGVQ